MATVSKLFDEGEIAGRVDALAREIRSAFPDEFVVVVVLKGAFVFAADLVRALGRLGAKPRVDFWSLASYGAATESSGRVRTRSEPPADVAGRAVLLVEDVLDSGHTIAFARQQLLERGARTVSVCVLVDKPARRRSPVAADLVGFTVGDRFVVGYGIDCAEDYRYLPYLAALD